MNYDEEIVEGILENQGIIFKVCNSYCNNKSDREDLAQEIMYQLILSSKSYNSELKLSTWMYRVALNVAISFYRKTKSSKTILMDEMPKLSAEGSENSSELESKLNALEQFIHELKELDKALMLLYLESKNYKEISEILGISETNVATKISRIKEVLKKKFEKTK
ncbi:MAG: RNA polymerase sigma factor [Ginsengibacter sp.]